jgi:tRNA pseudouridine13 synthase
MDIDERLGIKAYISTYPGIGGIIKEAEHFYVEEVARLPELHEDGRFVILRVKKVNWDTMNFARVLAKMLGISQKRVNYAGTKDKRAVSLQYFSISNVEEEKVQKLKELRFRDAKVEIIGKARRPIRLGDLIGNRFKIRVMEAEDGEKIHSILEELEQKGIPNYFGFQRFGSIRFITHEVGKYILKRDYETAFWTYVAKPFEGESKEVRKIREELWNCRDPRIGLRELPAYLRYERCLLQKLREGRSEEEAIRSLPKNLKLMFIHAYQSSIFNRVLSARIEEFESLKEIEKGDTVDFIRFEAIENSKYPALMESYTRVGKNYARVKFLVKEQRAFLTLPLPGYKTEFEDDWASNRVKRIIEEDEIELSDFCHEHAEFSSKGSYRVADMPLSLFDYLESDEILFSFFLPKGCYATSLLREFMKI